MTRTALRSPRALPLALCLFSLPPTALADEPHKLDTVYVSADAITAPGSSLNLNAPQYVGSRLPLTAKQIPASISAMTSEDITARNLYRAQDVVISMPGLTENPSPGNGGSALAARGFSGHNSVAQLLDGSRLIVAAGTITYPFSTWALERVEVLRGPASVLHGDGSIGAAVNYITKKPIWHKTEREAFFSAGSYGRVLSGFGTRGPINEELAYAFYLDGERADGYRDDTDLSRHNYSAALSYQPSERLKATFSLDGGVDNSPRYFGTPLYHGKLDKKLLRSNFNVKDSVVSYDDRVWRAKIEAQLSDDVSLTSETYHITTDRHWRNAEVASYRSASEVERDEFIEIMHDQTQTGSRLDLAFSGRLGALNSRSSVGIDWYKTRLIHTNNSPYTSPLSIVHPYYPEHGYFVSSEPTLAKRRAELQTHALYFENALDLSSTLKLVSGLRHEEISLDSKTLQTRLSQYANYHPTTGRIGLVWQATDTLAVYGQLGNGTDPLSGALNLPNNSEKFDLTEGQQVEIGLKGDLPSLRGQWTAAAYRIEKRDLLSRDPDDPNLTQQIGRVSSTGIELAFAAEPIENWTIEANLAALRAEYQEFNERVSGRLVDRAGMRPSGVPERTANIWTSWRFDPQWQVSLGARYVGSRPTNSANDAWLPSYTVSNAALAYDYTEKLKFSLQLNNLTDRVYAVSGTGDKRWLLAEPRTLQLTARLAF